MANNSKQLSFDKLLKLLSGGNSLIHFVGIGGVSMCSLARLALYMNVRVSGSDVVESERTAELRELGAKISIGHNSRNVEGATLVVYTHAVHADNPEILEAQRRLIPLVSRAEFMGALMIRYKHRVGVSGTHGKSTTVAMLDQIFSTAGAMPTVLSGASLPAGEPMKIGSDNLLIYEACEYKDSFLRFSPSIAIALNLELDHTDYFKDISSLRGSFISALGKASKCAVVNIDDGNLVYVAARLKNKVVTYGQSERADYRYRLTGFDECGYRFVVERYGNIIGNFNLALPGAFNVGNAVGAIVAAIEYGIDPDTVREAISSFCGISRRLELVGERFGRPVYYDYAHHPTEIRASINALKILTHDTVTVIFKPHTYTRTKSLWEEFILSLSLADRVILTDIYPAREAPIEGITSQKLAHDIGESAVYLDDNDILSFLDLHTHGTIVIMGAGDLDEVKEQVLHR